MTLPWWTLKAAELLFYNWCALSSRHGDFLLRPSQALRGRLRAGVSGGRGVSPWRGQVQLPVHHLQEPALCLPPAAQIRQPEDLHQGKSELTSIGEGWVFLCNCSLYTADVSLMTFLALRIDWPMLCFLNTRLETLRSASSSETQTMKPPPL